MIDAAQRKFLRELVAQRPDERLPSYFSIEFALNHNLGQRERGKIVYTARHFEMAERMLDASPAPPRTGATKRAETATRSAELQRPGAWSASGQAAISSSSARGKD